MHNLFQENTIVSKQSLVLVRWSVTIWWFIPTDLLHHFVWMHVCHIFTHFKIGAIWMIWLTLNFNLCWSCCVISKHVHLLLHLIMGWWSNLLLFQHQSRLRVVDLDTMGKVLRAKQRWIALSVVIRKVHLLMTRTVHYLWTLILAHSVRAIRESALS